MYEMIKGEKVTVAMLLIVTTLAYLVINKDVGMLYSIFGLLYLVSLSSNKWRVIKLYDRNIDLMKLVATTGISIGIFVGLSTLILGVVHPLYQSESILGVFKIMSTYSNIPIISTDFVVREAIWGVVIPIIESMFFLSFVLLLILEIFKVNIFSIPTSWVMLLKSPKAWWISALVGATASLFHMAVRVNQSYALIVDFVFFTMSAMMVLRYKTLLSPIIMHVFLNSMVLL